MVAIPVLLLIQVPPVVGDKVVVPPTLIDELPVILTVGNAFTVTTVAADAALVQPLALVTCTV
jgi:hypothetical protein